jgi:hypothetical protein
MTVADSRGPARYSGNLWRTAVLTAFMSWQVWHFDKNFLAAGQLYKWNGRYKWVSAHSRAGRIFFFRRLGKYTTTLLASRK